jgi:hypothetical protein
MKRFRLSRLNHVNAEALLVATGQNLKRKLGRRPWPVHAAGWLPASL